MGLLERLQEESLQLDRDLQELELLRQRLRQLDLELSCSCCSS